MTNIRLRKKFELILDSPVLIIQRPGIKPHPNNISILSDWQRSHAFKLILVSNIQPLYMASQDAQYRSRYCLGIL